MLLFEWNSAKARSNQEKHGIRFEDAMSVFDDPNALFMAKLVRKTLSSPTAAQSKRLATAAARPESEIDVSDIPELSEKFWNKAIRNPFYRPVKQQLTVRLDSDVVAWLRRDGSGYQTRLNQILRKAMIQDRYPNLRVDASVGYARFADSPVVKRLLWPAAVLLTALQSCSAKRVLHFL